MTRDEFLQDLASAGFEQITTVNREAFGALGTHVHPFEAKALILAGELAIRCADVERVYREGEVFHLACGAAHEESYGPQGVTYLVGRK